MDLLVQHWSWQYFHDWIFELKANWWETRWTQNIKWHNGLKIQGEQNSNKRMMAGTIIGETKREGQRKAKRWIACRKQKKGKS
jgi:hypothetical protein